MTRKLQARPGAAREVADRAARSADPAPPATTPIEAALAANAEGLAQSLRTAAQHMRAVREGLPSTRNLAPRVAVVLPCHNEATAIVMWCVSSRQRSPRRGRGARL